MCEKALQSLERKAKSINDLSILIMDTLRTTAKPKPRKRLLSGEEKSPENKLFSKVRGEQKRRVLFKEHSLG